MFLEIFKFETRGWFKNPLLYIFTFINFLMILTATLNENLTVGIDMSNININAPFTILNYAAFMSLLSIMFTTAFVNKAALKDFNNNFHPILFSTPIKKSSYVLGRFFSSVMVACIPLLGVLLALLVAPYFAGAEAKIGPVYAGAYLQSFVLFAIPNTLLVGAVIFTLASIFRNTTASFLGSIILLIGYLIAGNFMKDLSGEFWALILDPFGINSLKVVTKYWTIDDKNTTWLALSSPLILNRIFWIVVSLFILAIGYWRFSFDLKKQKKVAKSSNEDNALTHKFRVFKPLSIVETVDSFKTYKYQFWYSLKTEILGIIKNPAFLLITLFGLFNCWTNMSMADMRYGVGNHPVTFIILERIEGSLFIFITVIITYYSGLIVWKERQAKMNEIVDTAPYPTWVPALSKYFALVAVIGFILLMAMFLGMATQAMKGYYVFEPMLYIKQLFLINLSTFAVSITVAYLIHILVNNMYVGFFVFILVMIINNFLWSGININSNLLIINGTPAFTYSDMNQFLPWVKGLVAYKIYWSLFAGLLLIMSIRFWVRGKALNFKNRIAIGKNRMTKPLAMTSLFLLGLWLVTGGFLYYNAEIVNTNISANTEDVQSATYEEKYIQYADIPQPRIIALDCAIDIYPAKRSVLTKINVQLLNKHDQPIDSIHFTSPETFETQFDLPLSTMVFEDKELDYTIFKLDTPMMPGDTIDMVVFSDYIPRGIENEITNENITQNGIFFENQAFLPKIGYNQWKELEDNNTRIDKGLEKQERMNDLVDDYAKGSKNSYICSDADWIKLSCTLSTSKKQMAIAPGDLVKEWQEKDRRFFRYEVQNPAANFFSFLSAEYEVKREKWEGIDLEVYYHPQHAYNVDRMLSSLRNSLSYYTTNYTPYPHKQARIVEFPRFKSFAQAFPGTMPYSEGMGFLSDLKKEDDLDRSFFTVAHEMAHQWWGHQCSPADLQGGTMLAESFAQYSALMVMEKAYGKEMMGEFLKYEMDGYLQGRGRESTKELPLMLVEDQQYIHYNKGSVVLYALREYIGEDRLNKVMNTFAECYSFREPPYPSSTDFMTLLEAEVPDSLSYMVDDFFKKIVLYNNKITDATSVKKDNGQYEVNFIADVEKYEANGVGKETSVAFNDYINISIYGEPTLEHPNGKILYSAYELFDTKTNNISIKLDEKPFKVGIDPNYLLIDRFPEDNIVEL